MNIYIYISPYQKCHVWYIHPVPFYCLWSKSAGGKQPSKTGSKVWLTAGYQVWQVDQRVTLCSLWCGSKPGRITKRNGGLLYLHLPAVCPERLVSKVLGKINRQQPVQFEVAFKKKAHNRPEFLPLSRVQKTERMTKDVRDERKMQRCVFACARKHERTPHYQTWHILLSIFSGCLRYGSLFTLCLHCTWLIKSSWLFLLRHRFVLTHVCMHMKKTSFSVYMEIFMCLQSLLPLCYFHLT